GAAPRKTRSPTSDGLRPSGRNRRGAKARRSRERTLKRRFGCYASRKVSLPGMRCEIVHDPQEFARLARAWDELAHRAQVGLFLSHRWLSAWWRAFHGVDELWVLTLYDGERLAAAWPLHLKAARSQLRASELRVLGDLGGAQRSLLFAPGELE